jgi:hypothetical protein
MAHWSVARFLCFVLPVHITARPRCDKVVAAARPCAHHPTLYRPPLLFSMHMPDPPYVSLCFSLKGSIEHHLYLFSFSRDSSHPKSMLPLYSATTAICLASSSGAPLPSPDLCQSVVAVPVFGEHHPARLSVEIGPCLASFSSSELQEPA